MVIENEEILNGGVLVTSGSKLVVELCVALRLCLYAVNTSEARTLMNNALMFHFFVTSVE